MREYKYDYVQRIDDTRDGYFTIILENGTEKIIPKRAIIRIERNQTYGHCLHHHVFVDSDKL